MPRASLNVPTAILLAGAFIGLGLYFGLHGHAPDGTAPPSAEATVGAHAPLTTAPTTGHGEATAPPTGTTSVAPSTTVVEEQVKKALEAQRSVLVTKCWQPSVAATPTPASATYVFNFTFGADGSQITRGVREPRRGSRPDVTECLSRTMEAVRIPTPGASVYVEVPFTLP